jgi:phosphoheptose isomerase
LTQDTGGAELVAHRDHLPRRAGAGRPGQGQPDPGSQHIGALVGALSVLDTRLLDDWGQRLAVLMGRGGRLLVAGSSGSAAQAEHFAAQFTGRAGAGRGGSPAVALHSAVSAVSVVASDGSGREELFARQVRSHGRPGDVLLTMSTSGRNHGLLRAVAAARAGGIVAWCLTGPAPNPLADACDEAVCVYPAGARALSLTATVQEAHQVALHLIALACDATVLAGEDAAAGGPASGARTAFDLALRNRERRELARLLSV